MIQEGKATKVVLSNIYIHELKEKFSCSFLLKSLEERYPECTVFYFDYLINDKFELQS